MDFDWKQHPKAHFQLPSNELIEQSLKRKEGALASNGALVVNTGKYTGRSPQDRFIVRDSLTEKTVDWGKVNKPISPETFEGLLSKATEYLKTKEVTVRDSYACADSSHRFPIRVVTEFAWHNLFARQLFLRYAPGEKIADQPAMTIIVAPNCLADPKKDGTNSEAYILLDFTRRTILIGGTHYAGEIKKAIFSTLNFLLPGEGILTMHCSANVGEKKDVALFFGLSGTGKTTLSADPKRRLIGDDEHAWSDNGIFNLEGGCYAKTIRLSQKYEPLVWNAIRKGTVLENVVIDPQTKIPNYDDGSLTENTRAAYPIEYIDHAVIPSVGGQPNVIFFLTADAFGVLPPVGKLTPEEAMFHFLLGYTAKLAGTERGVQDPQATFSSCFGAPFLPRAAMFYAKMFQEKIVKYKTPVYLLNTGWIKGPFGVGERISLPTTRAIIDACISGAIKKANWKPMPQFHLSIPSECPGVPKEILDPANCWKESQAYVVQAEKLAALFRGHNT